MVSLKGVDLQGHLHECLFQIQVCYKPTSDPQSSCNVRIVIEN